MKKVLASIGEEIKRVREDLLNKLLIKLSSHCLDGYSQQLTEIEEGIKKLRNLLPSEGEIDRIANLAKTAGTIPKGNLREISAFISQISNEDIEKITTLAGATKEFKGRDAKSISKFIKKFSKEELEKTAILAKTERAISEKDAREIFEQFIDLSKDKTEKLEQIAIVLAIAEQLTKDELDIIEPSSKEVPLEAIIKYMPAINRIMMYLENIVDKHSEVASLYRIGVNLLKEKAYREAYKHFNAILDKNENLKGAWLNKGVALWGLGEFEGEIMCYDMALLIDKNYEKALHNMKVAKKRKEFNEVIAR
jgi:tetratricopeptide (TPR) repeat protein